MGQISILDTGYVLTDNSGTRLSGTNDDGDLRIANNGVQINLKSITITIQSGSSFDDTPVPSSFQENEINPASTENRKIIIEGVLDMRDATDIGYVYPLIRLPETEGWKAVFYTSTSGDKYTEQLIYQASNGHQFTANDISSTNFNLSSQYFYIPVRFKLFRPSQSPNSKVLRFRLEGSIDKYKESTLQG